MHSASDAYKQAMRKKIRDRAYISIGIGVINQNAQGSAKASGDFAYWSNQNNLFFRQTANGEYATLEKDFMKADGSQILLPDVGNDQYINTGLVMDNVLVSESASDVLQINFGRKYSIKGFTILFSGNYPATVEIKTDSQITWKSYDITQSTFTTTDVFDDTYYLQLRFTCSSEHGTGQRVRIIGITMGIGLAYGNADVETAELTEFTSAVCAEVPNIDTSVTVFDRDNRFNVDDDNSFINFLECKQKINISMGMTISDNSVEWIPVETVYLTDWKSSKGKMQFTANDIFSFMEDTYTLGNTIHTRTAYEEAVSILTDAGFEPDEYEIDEYMKDITLTNPMPENTHKECLQLLCNACRCVLYQDVYGKVVIKANFANVIEPEDITVAQTGASAWSHTENVLTGATSVYADLTQGFMRADGSQLLMPSDGNYVATTGYVTADVADADGLFEITPSITLKLPAGYSYFGVYLNFDGNAPESVTISTTYNGVSQDTVTFDKLNKQNLLNYEFQKFDTMKFEFTQGKAHNRICVNKIAFGNLSDYVLGRDLMTAEPVGYVENKVKDIYVRIFSFQNDENGKPQQVEDSVWKKISLNSTGENKYCENQLIGTVNHAEEVATWLGNYYKNNISYSAEYRGEPRMHATDIFFMETTIKTIQVETESCKLSFNGAFSGSLEMRKALRLGGE